MENKKVAQQLQKDRKVLQSQLEEIKKKIEAIENLLPMYTESSNMHKVTIINPVAPLFPNDREIIRLKTSDAIREILASNPEKWWTINEIKDKLQVYINNGTVMTGNPSILNAIHTVLRAFHSRQTILKQGERLKAVYRLSA